MKIPAGQETEIFVNEAGSVTIRQEFPYEDEPDSVALAPCQIPVVIRELLRIMREELDPEQYKPLVKPEDFDTLIERFELTQPEGSSG